MKKVYLQYWEESERGWGIRPDGCSLHLTPINHSSYLKQVYSGRDINNIPDEYDRIVDGLIEVEVVESVYLKVVNNGGTLRLAEYSMNNLRKLQELKPIILDELTN
jgi:hypothetical protein